jgi:hypothetical protein
MRGIVTSGKVQTLEEAKAWFRASWDRVKAGSRAHGGQESDC